MVCPHTRSSLPSHHRVRVFAPPQQELEFELPVEDETGRKQGIGEAEAADSPSDDDDSSPPVLRVTLSNGGEMALRPREVQVKRVP